MQRKGNSTSASIMPDQIQFGGIPIVPRVYPHTGSDVSHDFFGEAVLAPGGVSTAYQDLCEKDDLLGSRQFGEKFNWLTLTALWAKRAT